MTGLRGSHAGSFEVAHAVAREGRTTFPDGTVDPTPYDLIVVGAGVSGLAAAYFFRERKPDARILLLDNNDNFGGHAKRNEVRVDGVHLIGYGGSQTSEALSAYSDGAQRLLAGIDVDLGRFETAYDREFFKRNGLGVRAFFGTETYGRRALVSADLMGFETIFDTASATPPPPLVDAIGQMSFTTTGRAQLIGLVDDVSGSVSMRYQRLIACILACPVSGTSACGEALVTARFDYGQLDRPEHNVRLRLSSTAIRVARRHGYSYT